MNFPITLFSYIARRFFMWFSGVFTLFVILIFIADFVELTRRTSARADIGAGLLLKMSALKLPYEAQQVMPFAVLGGSILALYFMTRSRELIVARAAGISVWQFLMPAIAIAFLVGVIGVTLFNPIASKAQAEYKVLENTILKNQADSVMVNGAGLWLRQSDVEGTQAVIHALSRPNAADSPQTEMTLGDVTIYFFRDSDRLIRRIDAGSARLEAGRWHVSDGVEWRPDRDKVPFDEQVVPTNLTVQKIEESFASPDTMSFWDLPAFIELLEQSGFSAQKHQLYFDSLLARPLMLCAMVLIAAIFSLRMQRRGGTTPLMIGGICAGFLVYFLQDLVFALGASATIPVALAAWTPAVISSLLGTFVLLHLEDG
jgi:lipopolysaccharide export system permease protein